MGNELADKAAKKETEI